MKTMILCAGSGSRLRPVTDEIPKCMVPLGGTPLLEYTIEWLRSQDVSDYVINLHHFPDAVINHFGDGMNWGTRIHYSIEKTALGTAGGVRNVASEFEEHTPFLVWFGDNLSRCNIRQMEAFHRQHGGVDNCGIPKARSVVKRHRRI